MSKQNRHRELLHFLFQRFAINERVPAGLPHQHKRDSKASALAAAAVGFLTPASLFVKASAQGGMTQRCEP